MYRQDRNNMFRKLMKSSDRISIKFPQFLFLILYQIFPAKRSKRDANYFRRCEASKTQIITGEAKQARCKLFPAKRSKRDAHVFRQSEESETQVISGEAKQARRISITTMQSKRDANISGEAKQARRKLFPAM